jgi:hypothetical protein
MSDAGRGRPPEGQVRRSMILNTAGPGAVVDLIDHAVLIKGLDTWKYRHAGEGFLEEPRLEHQALAMLRAAGHWDHDHGRLRLPPTCDHDDPVPWAGVHARPFPGWYHCRTSDGLVGRDGLNDKGRHTCFDDGEQRPGDGRVVPIRFVAGCPSGHLQDIYWRLFVHRGEIDPSVDKPFACVADPDHAFAADKEGRRYTSDLALVALGASGELDDLFVRCRRCGAQRTLQDLRQPGALGDCRGWRPWLSKNDPDCEHKSRLLIRTGSNVWFAQRLSVLSIPDPRQGVRRAVGAAWELVGEISTLNELKTVAQYVKPLREIVQQYQAEAVMEAIQARRAGRTDGATIREVEWEALFNAELGLTDDLPRPDATWHARRVEIDHPTIARVTLVAALREVRAMVGFTRVDAIATGPEGELDLVGRHTAPLAEHADWIPAVEILGEGFFVAFHEHALRAWEARPDVQAREESFRRALRRDNALKADDRSMDRFTSARLILLHSLAHLLITEISLECGYSASAIRERIYCHVDPEDPARSRAGILLFTGTPGSEGTLGGLVEVGKDIVRLLDAAIARARICSNDPVCAQHRPDGDEDGRRREGAACHACLLIAETSCERHNRDLDRAMVVGTVEGEGVGFFG